MDHVHSNPSPDRRHHLCRHFLSTPSSPQDSPSSWNSRQIQIRHLLQVVKINANSQFSFLSVQINKKIFHIFHERVVTERCACVPDWRRPRIWRRTAIDRRDFSTYLLASYDPRSDLSPRRGLRYRQAASDCLLEKRTTVI